MSESQKPLQILDIFNTQNFITNKDYVTYKAQGIVTVPNGLKFGDGSYLNGDFYSVNGTLVLDVGTDGTDATFNGDVNGDLYGDIYNPNDLTKILDSAAGTFTGDVTGNVTGDLTGDIYNGSTKILDSAADTFTGNVIGNAETATKIATITNSDIVQLNANQILTNKTLDSPTITGTGAIAGTFTGDLTAGAVTTDSNVVNYNDTIPLITGREQPWNATDTDRSLLDSDVAYKGFAPLRAFVDDISDNSSLREILHLHRHCGDLTTDANAEGGYIGLYVTDSNNGGEMARISWRGDNAQNNEGDGRLSFWTSEDIGDHAEEMDIYERMTIVKDGKVGIGTTTPTSLLDVNGSLNVTGATTLASLDVTGATTLNSTLNVTGDVTANVTGNLYGDIYNSLNQQVFDAGDGTVSNPSTFLKVVNFTGGMLINSTLNLTNNIFDMACDFISDTDTGIRYNSANSFNLVAGNINTLNITDTGANVTGALDVTGATTLSGQLNANTVVLNNPFFDNAITNDVNYPSANPYQYFYKHLELKGSDQSYRQYYIGSLGEASGSSNVLAFAYAGGSGDQPKIMTAIDTLGDIHTKGKFIGTGAELTGTLDVTGATTLASTSASSMNVTGATTLSSLNVTGNITGNNIILSQNQPFSCNFSRNFTTSFSPGPGFLFSQNIDQRACVTFRINAQVASRELSPTINGVTYNYMENTSYVSNILTCYPGRFPSGNWATSSATAQNDYRMYWAGSGSGGNPNSLNNTPWSYFSNHGQQSVFGTKRLIQESTESSDNADRFLSLYGGGQYGTYIEFQCQNAYNPTQQTSYQITIEILNVNEYFTNSDTIEFINAGAGTNIMPVVL